MCKVGTYDLSQESLTSLDMLRHLRELPDSDPEFWKELNQRETVAEPFDISADPDRESPFLDKNECIDDSSIPVEDVASHTMFGELPAGVVEWEHGIKEAGESDDHEQESGGEEGWK